MTEQWETPFTPAELINIGPGGGNIGPFHWSNQVTFIIEQWGDNEFYESTIYEIPGVCAFLWSEFDWVAWMMGGFD